MPEEKFETKLKKLQSIVETLENDDVDLDKSISLYEEGLKLSKDLTEQLSKYDKMLEKISSENDD